MFATIRRFFTPADWQLVKTIEFPMRWGSKESGYEEGTLLYHLYESDKNTRRYEIATTFNQHGTNFEQKVKAFSTTTEMYQKRIFRWLKGRHDPKIPRYCEIGEEDLANELKGDI